MKKKKKKHEGELVIDFFLMNRAYLGFVCVYIYIYIYIYIYLCVGMRVCVYIYVVIY